MSGTIGISIHALREEGDYKTAGFDKPKNDFYPRPLRGGRQAAIELPDGWEDISIHALCEEGDVTVVCKFSTSLVFLSTPSARRETGYLSTSSRKRKHFYPRPPRGGRPMEFCFRPIRSAFLSTPSARRATY